MGRPRKEKVDKLKRRVGRPTRIEMEERKKLSPLKKYRYSKLIYIERNNENA